jgi:hypothetical protein
MSSNHRQRNSRAPALSVQDQTRSLLLLLEALQYLHLVLHSARLTDLSATDFVRLALARAASRNPGLKSQLAKVRGALESVMRLAQKAGECVQPAVTFTRTACRLVLSGKQVAALGGAVKRMLGFVADKAVGAALVVARRPASPPVDNWAAATQLIIKHADIILYVLLPPGAEAGAAPARRWGEVAAGEERGIFSALTDIVESNVLNAAGLQQIRALVAKVVAGIVGQDPGGDAASAAATSAGARATANANARKANVRAAANNIVRIANAARKAKRGGALH